jgi:methyl-accepting chemotaxis protein
VTQNSERSRRATDLADETKGLAERCGEMMHKTVAAMADIGVSGREIEVITDVIDDITRKTRLLALNASIEAGRAGEHGLGFAVVSSEIAALAERSSIAAQQIHDLVDESARRIATGSELVDESSSALREIVSATASAGELISDMVVASSEQAAGVEQVRRVVEELHEVTLQNAVLVSQSVDASGEMAEKAASLTRLVEFFKIDSDSPREDDAG